MTYGNELAEVNSYLYSTFSTDSTLPTLAPAGFWLGIADDGVLETASPPVYVAWHWQGAPDTRTSTSQRQHVRPLYLVEAVGYIENYSAIAAAATQIDKLLGKVANASTTNALIPAIYREQALERITAADGRRYVHLGGFYRFIILLK